MRSTSAPRKDSSAFRETIRSESGVQIATASRTKQPASSLPCTGLPSVQITDWVAPGRKLIDLPLEVTDPGQEAPLPIRGCQSLILKGGKDLTLPQGQSLLHHGHFLVQMAIVLPNLLDIPAHSLRLAGKSLLHHGHPASHLDYREER
jgi:hypothetical protein